MDLSLFERFQEQKNEQESSNESSKESKELIERLIENQNKFFEMIIRDQEKFVKKIIEEQRRNFYDIILICILLNIIFSNFLKWTRKKFYLKYFFIFIDTIILKYLRCVFCINVIM